ncbi:MAG: cytidylate kinase-like family protein [Spirochaetia bacterium]|nr:cytidylate kinase-like family protein [Spirochaetia bacterium]
MKDTAVLNFVKDQLINADENIKIESPGPVITISREYGCGAWDFAENLQKTLNNLPGMPELKKPTWRIIGKEIISQAAKELDIEYDLAEKLFKEPPPGLLEEMFHNLSEYYRPSDMKVKKTVAGIIKTIINKGHIILIGRGGVILAKDIQKSFHIRLQADKLWRIKQAQAINKISEREAEKLVERIDRERKYLKSYLAGEEVKNDSFDIIFNSQTLSVENMCDSLLPHLKNRGIIS